jgi:hypothetical protein
LKLDGIAASGCGSIDHCAGDVQVAHVIRADFCDESSHTDIN